MAQHEHVCTDIVCPHHFKCNEYYCVPFKYTCNGRNDCPLGDDEQSCADRNCTGLFKCQNTNTCLHFYEVSDGTVDCKDGDDELYPDLGTCPMHCDCLTLAAKNMMMDDAKCCIRL